MANGIWSSAQESTRGGAAARAFKMETAKGSWNGKVSNMAPQHPIERLEAPLAELKQALAHAREGPLAADDYRKLDAALDYPGFSGARRPDLVGTPVYDFSKWNNGGPDRFFRLPHGGAS